MSSDLQLILIIVNVIYGFIVFYLCLLNYKMIRNEPIILKLFITSLFTMDLCFVYLVIIYKLTGGIFSLYYLVSFIIGLLLGYSVKKRVNMSKFSKKLIDMKKNK